MPKYLVQATYSTDGLKGLLKEKGSGRREAVTKAIESVGGKLETMYYAFGDDDVVLVADFPDNISAAAISLTVSAAGAARTKTTPLMTVEEVDRAIEKTVRYRAAGA